MAQTLGTVAVGTVVKINESGSPVNYIVVHQGLPSSMYDASCDGTWLLRQDIAENRVWNSTSSNVLESSSIQSYLNGTWVNRYDTDIRNAIKQVKIPYRQNGGTGVDRTGANGLSCKIFLLSGYEVGWTTSDLSYFPVDGAKLAYFISGTSSSANNKRIAYLDGSAAIWWLRSPYAGYPAGVLCVYSEGNYTNQNAMDSRGVRPAFVLSKNIYVEDDGTVVLYPSPSPITVPSVSMQGQSINVSWSSVDGADSYILQRKADSGEWEQVYAGADLTFTDTAGSWSTVQYQVCGVFDGVNGAFAQSEIITVVPASALVVSGTDGDLGTITSDVSYFVATDSGNSISLTLTVNGAQFFSGSVGTSYASSIPVMDLPTGTNTIVITATVQTSSDPVTVTRTWTYTKVAQTFPGSGGVAALSQDGQPIFPQTLAEAVKAIGGPWGGNLSSALNKLAMAATWTNKPVPVTVDMSMISVGDIVNLPVNGVMVPHIVVQVGNPDPSMYDSSCNGVWLLRKDIVENGQWNSTNVNTLAGSTIMATMQEYVDDYDSTVQAAMLTVRIPYCVGNGSATVNTLANGLECKFFPLSGYEVGFTTSNNPNLPVDGAVLSYFQGTNSSADNKRIAYLNGVAANWWLRSSNTGNTTTAFGVGSTGSYYFWAVGNSVGIRPCFLLPTTFTATYYVDTAGNVYPSQEYTTAGDFYDLWGNVIPTVKITTGKYTGTGTYGADNPNALTLPFEPKVLIVSAMTDAQTGHTAWIYGDSRGAVNSSYAVILSWDNNTVSWYSTNSASYQLNGNALSYQYVAIG